MARAKGKHIARPPIAKELQVQKKEDLSMNKISKTLGIAYGPVYNYRLKS